MHQVRAFFVADFTCPFSYVTEAFLCRWEDEREARVPRLAYELAPRDVDPPPPFRPDEMPPGFRELVERAEVRLGAPSRRPPTDKAHEAERFARTSGRDRELRREVYRAYFEDDADIGRIDILVECAERVGIDTTPLRIALDIDRFASAVQAERDRLIELGIGTVPRLLPAAGESVGALEGAHPYEVLDEHLSKLI